MTAPRSPFLWDTGEPTIFREPQFTGTKKRPGKTISQINSETVARITRETGRNPGTITGISRKQG
jgi:hypothetical protein